MSSPLNTVSEFQIVMHRLLITNEHAVMLSWGSRYAVCKTQPQRSLVITTNYDCPEQGILTAPLNLKGLQDLLSWVDLSVALTRFNAMVGTLARPAPELFVVANTA